MPPYTRAYENWAPVVARWLLAFQFGVAAYFKVMFFQGQVLQTGAAGVPFPALAVGAALVLEVLAGLCLLLGWHARVAAALLAPYVLLLALIFYHNFSDGMTVGLFISHLGLIAALLYVSVYGARHFALRKD